MSSKQVLAESRQLVQRGAYPQAIEGFTRALALSPGHYETRLELAKANLDWALIQSGKELIDVVPETLPAVARHHLTRAETLLAELLAERPSNLHALSMMSIIHLVHERHESALKCVQKALKKDGRDVQLLYNEAYLLHELRRHDEAQRAFRKLLALHPKNHAGWHMYAESLYLSGQIDAALETYRKSLALNDAKQSETYGAYAGLLKILGRDEEALTVLREATGLFRSHPVLAFSRATTALGLGEWREGWCHYVCRTSADRQAAVPADFRFEWSKEIPVAIKYDQGLGDELFFLRFAPALAEAGMRIAYATQAKLLPMLEGMACLESVEAVSDEAAGRYDALVGDLPLLADMRDSSDIPPPLPLSIDGERQRQLRQALEAFGPPPYLGITWQAGVEKSDRARENRYRLHKLISPADLGEIARIWPGTVVVLQRTPKPEDLAAFSDAAGRSWLDWSGVNDDLRDALAALSLLDDYVGVSNTNMHLLAGIGKTARVLVPSPPEWRWMAQGDTSPWFPGFRIYRQSQDQSWGNALTRVKNDLGLINLEREMPQ